MKTIGILLFDGVEELDAVGPYEVLGFWTRNFPDDGWQLLTVSRDGDPVTAAKGLLIGAQASYASLPELDVLIYPGGEGTRPHMRDETQLTWLREQRAKTPLLASVCTGSLVFAAAGLLRDRPATTHWSAFEELLAADPTLKPDREARYVDDGDIVTAAGVSAGIDMALHLVRRLTSEERARQVRRGIHYDPKPPV